MTSVMLYWSTLLEGPPDTGLEPLFYLRRFLCNSSFDQAKTRLFQSLLVCCRTSRMIWSLWSLRDSKSLSALRRRQCAPHLLPLIDGTGARLFRPVGSIGYYQRLWG